MSLRRRSATLWLAALAAMTAASCATAPAPAPATPKAPAAAPAAKPAAPKPSTPATPAKAVERPAAFAVCGACHGSAANAPPSLGPNLFGVAGNKAGTTHPDYDYSAALKGSGKVWTPENLAAFVQDPGKFIPGNNMDFSGIPDAAAAKSIADYMASLH